MEAHGTTHGFSDAEVAAFQADAPQFFAEVMAVAAAKNAYRAEVATRDTLRYGQNPNNRRRNALPAGEGGASTEDHGSERE